MLHSKSQWFFSTLSAKISKNCGHPSMLSGVSMVYFPHCKSFQITAPTQFSIAHRHSPDNWVSFVCQHYLEKHCHSGTRKSFGTLPRKNFYNPPL